MAPPDSGEELGLPPPSEAAPEPGWIAPELAEEFPGLALRYTTIEAGSGRSPRSVKQRLRELSDRFYGSHAVNMRQKPIPWAYRVFYRHIGLDPDEQPTPVEELALSRMKHGRFRSQNRLDDALTIATIEIGVALRAFDADRIEGRLGIRASAPGEKFEGRPGALPTGTLVIADERRPVGLLFGATAAGRGVQPRSRRTLLAVIQVRGVPDIAVEEALWLATAVVTAD
jgi:DNA/RNA-binding domain of Phe-tRNA-synthetase-like protein